MSDKPAADAAKGQILLLATESQAYAFDLSETFRIAIGRHESNDIQLHSRNVSNHHAEILNEAGGVHLHDLRSTNGTFLNDEKVRQRELRSGDKIRIGSHVLTVNLKERKVAWEGASRLYSDGAFEIGTKGKLVPVRASAEQARKTHPSGSPSDLALADLLKILTSIDRLTLLEVRDGAHEARIILDKGGVLHAECARAKGEKALYRVFRWESASYELKAVPSDSNSARTIALPTDTLISEGVQQAEEVDKLLAQLPEAPLRLKEDCPLPLAALSPAEIGIYQSLIRYETIDKVLEESSLPDYKALSLIQTLIRKGVFEDSSGTDSLLEGTVVSQSKMTEST
jgi:predicted component of type VI protein secretion system